MALKGFGLIIIYLDDVLIIADSEDTCAQALTTLIQLFRKLGFAIHWGKVVDPTHKITFLGIELNSLIWLYVCPKTTWFKTQFKLPVF